MSKRTSKQELGPWQRIADRNGTGWMRARGLLEDDAQEYSCGDLIALVGSRQRNERGWHLSISAPGRYPTWDEIAHARYSLLPADKHFAMVLPPEDQYVNLDDGRGGRAGNIFHLWEVEYETSGSRIGRMLMRGLR